MKKWKLLLVLLGLVVVLPVGVVILKEMQNIQKEAGRFEEESAPQEEAAARKTRAEMPDKAGPSAVAVAPQAKPATAKEEKPEEPKAEKTATKASDPMRTGVKERLAPIMEKDEYYMDEYTDQKITSAPDPAPVADSRPQIAWRLKFGASVCGKPVVKDGKLYISCYDKQVFMLDAATGRVLQKAKLWYQPIGSPSVFQDNVIFSQRNGNLTSFNMASLKKDWNSRSAVETKEGAVDVSISTAVVRGKYLYTSKHWGNLYVYNAADGAMLSDPGVLYESRINTPAVTHKGDVIYSNVAGELVCFSQDGKKQRWKTEIEAGYPLSLEICNDLIVLASTEKELLAINAKDQKLVWKEKLTGLGFDSILEEKGWLYVSAGDIYCVNSKDGRIIWQLQGQGMWDFCRGPVVLDKATGWALSRDGALVRFSASTGSIEGSFKVSESGKIWNHLARAESLLFVSNDNKELFGVKGL